LSETPFTITESFVAELLGLNSFYGRIRTEQNWRPLFLLQYHHANLNVFDEFLERFIDGYVNSRRQDFDPRSSKLSQWVLREMAEDSYHYRQLTDIGNELAETVESLLEVAKASLYSPEHSLPGMATDSRSRKADLQQKIRAFQADLRRRQEKYCAFEADLRRRQ
jgi:hypothetical protein